MASQPKQTTADTARSMTLAEILALLSRTRLFAGLNKDQVALFANALEGISFETGDELLTKGDLDYGLNIMLRGGVQVFLPVTNKTTEVKLGVLQKGEFFGEYAVFDDRPASASIRALRAGDLIRFPRSEFRAVLNANPVVASTVYYNLLHVLVERLRATGQDFEVLLSGNAEMPGV